MAMLLIAALLAVIPQGAAAIESPLSHVTVSATLDCRDFSASQTSVVKVWLSDVTVAGREYYPAAAVESLTKEQVRFSFDAPGGVYYISTHLEPEAQATSHDCSWSGSLMTLPGINKSITVTFQSMIAHLWDTSDFAAGTIAGNATVAWEKLPRDRVCGTKWVPSRQIDSSERQSGTYYVQFPWLSPRKEIPALVVTDGAHTTVVSLPPIETTPLQEHHYIRRDITATDLIRWSSLPAGTIVCDAPASSREVPQADQKQLQRVTVTAFIQCSDENELYASETPSVEIEDQLHRGRFFFPRVSITKHVGSQVVLSFMVPPGAYDLGMRLPRPAKAQEFVLPCYSAARVAVLPGRDRHLTFLICSCGDSGSDRGFVAGRLEPSSMSVAVTMIPRSVACKSEIPDITAAIQDRAVAVMDGGYYYAKYSPYDPEKQPVLVISGIGLSKFVAIRPDAKGTGMESLIQLDITNAKLQQWYKQLRSAVLLC